MPSGANTITFHDILVGDVWVCSGQSNMQFPTSRSSTASTELPKANHPDIRLFVVKIKTALKPQDACEGTWALCTPQSATGFSAVGYYFGQEIAETEKVPVGLIGSYVGANPAQAWTSLEAMNADPDLKVTFKNVGTGLKIGPNPVTPPGTTPPPTDVLKGFAIAGSDRKFVWAKATISGPGTVTLSADGVRAPVFIRYAYESNPEVNLYNSGDLPASPFRTDPAVSVAKH